MAVGPDGRVPCPLWVKSAHPAYLRSGGKRGDFRHRIDCVVELTFAQTTKNGGSSRVALSCSSSVSATPLLDRRVGHLIQHPLPFRSASRLMGATVFHRFYMLCNAVWLRLQSVLSF